jgi:RNA polymerase sigma factor (sigma-70 family)
MPPESGFASSGSLGAQPVAATTRLATWFDAVVAGRSTEETRAGRPVRSFEENFARRRLNWLLPNLRAFRPAHQQAEGALMNGTKCLTGRIDDASGSDALPRYADEKNAVVAGCRRARDSAVAGAGGSHSGGLHSLLVATRQALENGDVAEANRFIDAALEADASLEYAEEWRQVREVGAWPDTWLVAAVRRDPPDVAALDTLAERYWKPLFGRCQLLTLDHQKAGDLAQEAWCRVLRARHGLKPDGNFPAYLTTIATNLWRDRHRSARRAGLLAEDRLLALDASLPLEEGESIMLADVLPDLNALQAQEQTLLALDIDQALKHLAPQLREVLVARFLTGESCAEIGRRYGRTEQTISGWVREAVRNIRQHFEEPERLSVAQGAS